MTQKKMQVDLPVQIFLRVAALGGHVGSAGLDVTAQEVAFGLELENIKL